MRNTRLAGFRLQRGQAKTGPGRSGAGGRCEIAGETSAGATPQKGCPTSARILGKRIGKGQRQAVRGFECRGPSRVQIPERVSKCPRWAPQPTNAGLGGRGISALQVYFGNERSFTGVLVEWRLLCVRAIRRKTGNQEDLDDPREDDEDEHDDSELEVEMH